MKLEKSVTVDGKKMTYDEIVADMESKGINSSKFEIQSSSKLPLSGGTFTSYDIVTTEINGEDRSYPVFIVEDKDGKQFECSLGKIAVMGTIKKTDTEEFNPELIKMSRKEKAYISGEQINPDVSSNPALAAVELIGTKFKSAKLVNIWAAPFLDGGYSSKDELLQADKTVRQVYKLQF